MVEQEFKDLRELLLIAGSCKKPDQGEFEKLLGPLQKDIEAITRAKEANRKDREWLNHLSTIAEGAPCVGWVTVVSSLCFMIPSPIFDPGIQEPTPGPFLAEIKDSTQFYANRVMKEFKEKYVLSSCLLCMCG